MSNIAIKGGATGTAVFTIESPTTSTDRTLTLPDVTATVITDSAGVLNIGSGQVYKDGSGNVGLGTTSPFSAANQTSLTINATTYPRLDFYSGDTQRAFLNSGATDTNLYTVGATPLTFGTNNT